MLYYDGNGVKLVADIVAQFSDVADDEKLHFAATAHEGHASNLLDNFRSRLSMWNGAVLDVPKYCRKYKRENVTSGRIISLNIKSGNCESSMKLKENCPVRYVLYITSIMFSLNGTI